eukprot:scaffold94510_cov85-Phaeocystis_antarctica.AAC.1
MTNEAVSRPGAEVQSFLRDNRTRGKWQAITVYEAKAARPSSKGYLLVARAARRRRRQRHHACSLVPSDPPSPGSARVCGAAETAKA